MTPDDSHFCWSLWKWPCCYDVVAVIRWQHVAYGETSYCVKEEMTLDCFDLFCVSLYTSLFGAITASISCLNFRSVSSWLGFALISSSGICSWNDLRAQRQPHDEQRLLFPSCHVVRTCPLLKIFRLSLTGLPLTYRPFIVVAYCMVFCPAAAPPPTESCFDVPTITHKALSISLWKGSRRFT